MTFDPFSAEFIDNPYEVYAAWRSEGPVVRPGGAGFAILPRYDDVREALRDPASFSSAAMRALFERVEEQVEAAEIGDARILIGADPPVHTRLRKIVNRGFTPKRVAAWEPRIRAIAEELVDELAGRNSCDLIGELAMPLPVRVIAEILGIAPERFGDFKRWSDALISMLVGIPTPERLEAVEKAFEEMGAYLRSVVEARRTSPREDMISALVQAEEAEDVLTEDELGMFIGLLLVGGNETTTNLIGNAVLALIEHPDVFDAVLAEPGLIARVVEETLRYDAPIQQTLRRVECDLEISGARLRAGETVSLLLGSANRDERHFPHAERFDPLREGSPHLAFGNGTHFCLGAGLARLEAAIALETLIDRVGRVTRPDGPLERSFSLLVRGPRRLPVSLRG